MNNKMIIYKEEKVKALNKILLDIGGKNTNVIYDEETENILIKGELFNYEMKHHIGTPGQCHRNATDLWDNNKDRLILCTGYALYENMWYCHSWLIDTKDDTIIETNPVTYEKYYGITLDHEESVLFVNGIWC